MAGGPLAPPVQPNPPDAFEAGPAPVLMAFAGPAKQSRLTVFFRIILAIPQLIVLAVIGIVAEIVLVIGWFGALFMGRLPRFAADFLPGYLRWATRVSAYLALLTGEYPPFTFDDVDYPIRLAVRPGKLNRLAVLFRFVLVIPAEIVGYVAVIGLYTIGLFITWLIVLFSGIMPTPLYQAIAAVLRFQTGSAGICCCSPLSTRGGFSATVTWLRRGPWRLRQAMGRRPAMGRRLRRPVTARRHRARLWPAAARAWLWPAAARARLWRGAGHTWLRPPAARARLWSPAAWARLR